MRLLRGVIGIGTLVAACATTALVSPSANADGEPTITGPASVARGTIVTLSGQATPGAQVTVYLEREGDKSFFALTDAYHPPATADDAGQFTVRYFASSDAQYYAKVGDVVSPTGITQATGVTINEPPKIHWPSQNNIAGFAKPGASVVVYRHTPGSSGYTAQPAVRADTHGFWLTTYNVRSDVRLYAQADGSRSAATLVKLVRDWLPSSLNSDQSGPEAWNSCVPSIPVWLNPSGAPAGFESLVIRMVNEGKAATGLPLRYAGHTSKSASDGAIIVRLADQSAPVLNPRAGVRLKERGLTQVGGNVGDELPDGIGIYTDGSIYQGQLVLNRQALPGLMRSHAPGQTLPFAYSYLLHAFGHTLGLSHTDESRPGNHVEIMSGTQLTRFTHYQPGDRVGLAAVGKAAGCPRQNVLLTWNLRYVN